MWARAIKSVGPSLPGLWAMLDASGVAGTWDWCLTHGTVLYDAGAAELLAGDPDLAGCPLRVPEAASAVHPDDAERVMDAMHHAGANGGLILAQYRVVHPVRGIRCILSRGRVHRSESGRPLRAHGILFDITDDRTALCTCSAGPVSEADSLNRVVDHCAGLREEAGRLGCSKLRLLVDMMLLEVGQQLARRLRN